MLNLASPLGAAIGYAFSALVAANMNWQWAFIFEAIFMAPFALSVWFMPRFHVTEALGDTEEKPKPSEDSEAHQLSVEMTDLDRSKRTSQEFVDVSLDGEEGNASNPTYGGETPPTAVDGKASEGRGLLSVWLHLLWC